MWVRLLRILRGFGASSPYWQFTCQFRGLMGFAGACSCRQTSNLTCLRPGSERRHNVPWTAHRERVGALKSD